MKHCIVRIFECCGYTVSSPDKAQNPVGNLVDGVLLVIYTFLSLYNVIKSDTSIILLFINAITLTRFMVKNLIEQKMIVNSKINDGKNKISLVHWSMVIIEAISMIILTVFFVWAQFNAQGLSVVRLIVGIVIILTLVEDALDIFERLYQATPKPLLY